MLQHGIANSVWVSNSEREVGSCRKKFSGREERAERETGFFGAQGPTELRQV